MTSDTADLLDFVGWTSGVNVVGVSLGGMIAQELAMQDTKRIKSLCLISTHSGFSFPSVDEVG